MKFTSKMLAGLVALAVLISASVTALAEYGSGSVVSGQTYTTEQMLTYAIQDEYMARAEYQAIMDEFGVSRPFSNTVSAEQYHISLLTPLFAAYGVEIPADDAASRVTVPETLALAYDEGIKTETNNIQMYETFVSQNLPDDVKAVFTALKAASENHLKAFEQNTDRAGSARMGNQANGRGMGGNARGNARSARGNGGNLRGTCGSCANCPVANPAA